MLTRLHYYCTTIALLLHDYCAIYDPPPTPLVYAIQLTMFGRGNIVKRPRCTVQLFRLPECGGHIHPRRYLLLSLHPYISLQAVTRHRQ